MKSVALIILDGFGLRPDSVGNAVIQAKTPFFDYLIANHKTAALQAAGEAVGLPWGEMGNSEVGHLNIGCGRVVLQDYPQISRAISDGSFFENSAFKLAVAHVKKNRSRLHFLGLVSKGAVHAHIEHLYGLLELAKRNNLKDVFVHAILDGRDAPPRSAQDFLTELLTKIARLGVGQVATAVGRYYAMDRDKRFDRTKIAYDALVVGKGEPFENLLQSIDNHYKKGDSDEFMPPLLLDKGLRIGAGDAVIFFNFRADRAIQLTRAFVDPSFTGFGRPLVPNLKFVTLTNYEHDLPLSAAFTPIMLNNPQVNPLNLCLTEVVASQGLTQLRIAETEKYAHVTYFFNAGASQAFPQEKRILVPSPKVATYDASPAMSANGIAAAFVENFNKLKPALAVVNFANADMLGHTGNMSAAAAAVGAMDKALKVIVELAASQGCVVMITGDHGNAETMIDAATGAPDKEHTVNPVPLAIVERRVEISQSFPTLTIDEKIKIHSIKPIGIFADVAPTILDYLQIPAPAEMTGVSLKNVI